MAEAVRRVVQRARKVSYMDVGTSIDAPVWTRMRGFTTLSKSKETEEYERQYVDEYGKTVDPISMSEAVEFEFDEYTNDEPQKKVKKVFDKELLGDEANVRILTVDYSSMLTATGGTMPSKYPGVIRTYAVIPDGEGDGVESYKYTGSFKAKTPVQEVEVTAPQNDKSVTVTTTTPTI